MTSIASSQVRVMTTLAGHRASCSCWRSLVGSPPTRPAVPQHGEGRHHRRAVPEDRRRRPRARHGRRAGRRHRGHLLHLLESRRPVAHERQQRADVQPRQLAGGYQLRLRRRHHCRSATSGRSASRSISLRVPEEIVRTVDYPEGDGRKWDATSLAFGLTYARNLTDRFSIGFNAKYIRESIWSESASGFAIDVGTLYLSEIPGLTLGASISNFGTTMQLDGRDLNFNYDPNDDAGTGPNNIPSQTRDGSVSICR